MATTKRSTAKTSSHSTNSGTKRSSTSRATRTGTRSSEHKTHKTGSKTAHGQAWTDKRSDNPSSTGHDRAKKEPSRQTSRCWPGYEPVPGTKRGEKGSCKPKAHQTASEKKSDAMAASAGKLQKAGGSKARANRSH